MHIFARTLTDSYWVRHHTSMISFSQLQFNSDDYADLTLKLDLDILDSATNKFTPELTNTGSYEKGWKLIDGKWYLYKSGTEAEVFSEVFSCILGKACGFNMVEYAVKDGKSV